MKNTDGANRDLLPDKMNIELDVLRPSVLNRIGREIHGADVVTVDNSGRGDRTSQLLQKMVEPTCLRDNSSHPTVFGFGT
jgi:hypothetical protein